MRTPAVKLRWSTLGGDVEDVKVKRAKGKTKEIVQSVWVAEYFKERDRVLWRMFPNSRKEIEERYL